MRYPWLPPALLQRYVRSYGTRIDLLLARRNRMADMGEEVLPGLYAAEIAYLVECEWARSAEDILWRRSKLGLHVAPGSAGVLDGWLEAWRVGQVEVG